MATRRDQDLPSHPSTSPGGRPRIPEREITDTDVTQHAQEVLTDQDFLITSPSEGDYFRHDGSDWVNVSGLPEADVTAHEAALAIAFTQLTGSIANGQVPQSAITQHESALSIAESQIDNGTLLARLGDDDTITGAWTFGSRPLIELGGDEMLRLKHTSATGNPFLTFYQDSTRKAYIQFHDNGYFVLASEEGPLRLWRRDGGDEILRIRHNNTAGEPEITFYQSSTKRASILYQDTNDTMRFAVENNASATFEWYADGVQVMFLHSTIGLQVRAGDIVCENGDVTATV